MPVCNFADFAPANRDASCPMTMGKGWGYSPSMKCKSECHKPLTAVPIGTSRGFGLRVLIFSITSGIFASQHTAAFIGPCLQALPDNDTVLDRRKLGAYWQAAIRAVFPGGRYA